MKKTSRFRAGFKLEEEDVAYIDRIGMAMIELHAHDFVTRRLAPEKPKNDGKQTPYKGHPVFKAQHATATCCRGCLSKWYRIPKDRALNRREIDFASGLIVKWIKENLEIWRTASRGADGL
jgi:hypothetical protein